MLLALSTVHPCKQIHFASCSSPPFLLSTVSSYTQLALLLCTCTPCIYLLSLMFFFPLNFTFYFNSLFTQLDFYGRPLFSLISTAILISSVSRVQFSSLSHLHSILLFALYSSSHLFPVWFAYPCHFHHQNPQFIANSNSLPFLSSSILPICCNFSLFLFFYVELPSLTPHSPLP